MSMTNPFYKIAKLVKDATDFQFTDLNAKNGGVLECGQSYLPPGLGQHASECMPIHHTQFSTVISPGLNQQPGRWPYMTPQGPTGLRTALIPEGKGE